MKDVGEKLKEPITLFYANKLAITMARNLVFHSRTKHIAFKYHIIHEAIKEGEVKIFIN